MTPHAALYAALTASHPPRGGRQPTLWTRAEVTACLASWAAEHERPPTSSELGPRHQLPGYATIALVWGSVEAVYTALGWPYHRYAPGSGGGRPPLGEAVDSVGECGAWLNGESVIEVWENVGEWFDVVL